MHRSPLNVDQLKKLHLQAGDESNHLLFRKLADLPLLMRLTQTQEYLAATGDRWKELIAKDSNEKDQFVEDSLMKSAIANRVKSKSVRVILDGLEVFMKQSGISMVPINNDRVVIRYKATKENARVLDVPSRVRGHFQRYEMLGEKTLTFEEMVALYKHYVGGSSFL